MARFLISVCVLASPSNSLAGPVDETTRAFIKHVQNSDEYSVDAKAFVEKVWAERKEESDAEEFMLEALAVLAPEFADALDAYDDDDYEQSFARMNALSGSGDPYLSANASVYAVKSLIEQDQVVEAAARIREFLADPTAVDLYTPYAAEMAFLKGFTELQTLAYDDAAKSLSTMLERYPEAPDRLRVSARQMLAELRSREPERLGDVADLMVYSGRRLGQDVTDDDVQARQQRAIELLEQLIEEAENNENNSGGGGGNNNNPGGQQSPQTPMEDSKLPTGGSRLENLRNSRQIRPGEAWGSMKPAEREKILQSLRDSFPSRYRQLVEQYYEDLSKKP